MARNAKANTAMARIPVGVDAPNIGDHQLLVVLFVGVIAGIGRKSWRCSFLECVGAALVVGDDGVDDGFGSTVANPSGTSFSPSGTAATASFSFWFKLRKEGIFGSLEIRNEFLNESYVLKFK